MKLTNRLAGAAVVCALGVSLLAAPLAARASEEGRRNTALGLGAAAAYLLLNQRDKTAGVVAAAGAAYAYKRYNDAVNDRHNRERYGYYDGRYRDRNYGDTYNRSRTSGDRYYDARTGDRYYDSGYDSRYDSRYDNRYDSRYDSRYDRDTYSRSRRSSSRDRCR